MNKHVIDLTQGTSESIPLSQAEQTALLSQWAESAAKIAEEDRLNGIEKETENAINALLPKRSRDFLTMRAARLIRKEQRGIINPKEEAELDALDALGDKIEIIRGLSDSAKENGQTVDQFKQTLKDNL